MTGRADMALRGIPFVLLWEGYPSRADEIPQARDRILPYLLELIHIRTGTGRRDALVEVFFGLLKHVDSVQGPFFGGIPRRDNEQPAYLPYSFFKASRRERPGAFFVYCHGKSLPSAFLVKAFCPQSRAGSRNAPDPLKKPGKRSGTV